MALEAKVYEPERRDSKEKLALAFRKPDGVAVVAEAFVNERWILVGGSLAAPLEWIQNVSGVDHDPFRGHENTIYALSTTLDPKWRGYGFGRRMKEALLREAQAISRADGSPRYQFLSGRMRIGATSAMNRINSSFGATEVFRFRGEYGGKGEAIYYRMPLGAPTVASGNSSSQAAPAELADLCQPLMNVPIALTQLYRRGALYGPAIHKLTLVNYVTPAVIRALEYLSALSPVHPHLFLTSSRDETFDKSLRLLRHHRPEASIALGFEGGYVGHTSAAARSLSDPHVHRQKAQYFDCFSRLPHPASDPSGTIDQLKEYLKKPSSILGLWLEPVQERTGQVIPRWFFEQLNEIRLQSDLPIVFVENATSYYRYGSNPFFDHQMLVPDIITWFGGGQIGFLHVNARYFVSTPLTMVSTWDGDELSLIRVHHYLRALRNKHQHVAPKLEEELEKALAPLVRRGVRVEGRGFFRVAHLGAQANRMVDILHDHKFRAFAYPHGAVPFALPLDFDHERFEDLKKAALLF